MLVIVQALSVYNVCGPSVGRVGGGGRWEVGGVGGGNLRLLFVILYSPLHLTIKGRFINKLSDFGLDPRTHEAVHPMRLQKIFAFSSQEMEKTDQIPFILFDLGRNIL